MLKLKLAKRAGIPLSPLPNPLPGGVRGCSLAHRSLPSPACGTAEGSLRSNEVLLAGEGAGGEGNSHAH
jgi:hypothetical protein